MRTMNAKPKRLDGEQGYVLLGVLVLALVMLIVGMAFFAIAGYETRLAHVDAQSQQAFWLAEGGKERALRWMAKRDRPPDNDLDIYVDEAGPDGGTYSVKVYVDPNAMFSPTKEFELESVGDVNGVRRRIRQRIQMESFAKYAYFTDDESAPGGGTIWFIGADRLEGPVHSNGTIHISGNPRFLSEVTSHSDHMIGSPNHNVFDADGWPVAGNNPQFSEGFKLGIPIIPLPTETSNLKDAAQAGGLHLGAAMDIELGTRADGSTDFAWFRFKPTGGAPAAWNEAKITALPTRVIYSEGDLYIKGILDGELTISSKGNIYIVDDLTYAGSDAAGTPNAGCNDLLGLVAEENIIFKDLGAVTNNLKVNAVMMALDTSITAENYGSGAPRGTLTIWGGLIQKYRGAVGQFDSGTGAILHGYAKNYHYDPRVTGRTPPEFPLRGDYTEIGWNETWDETPPF